MLTRDYSGIWCQTLQHTNAQNNPGFSGPQFRVEELDTKMEKSAIFSKFLIFAKRVKRAMLTPTKAQKQRAAARAKVQHPGRPRGSPIRPPQPSDDARNQPVRERGECLGCAVCAAHGAAACSHLHLHARPRKFACISQLAHPPTDVETRVTAVAEYRTRQAVARETGTRVSGARIKEIAQRIALSERQLRRLATQLPFRSLSRRPGSGRRPTVSKADLARWFAGESQRTRGGGNGQRSRWQSTCVQRSVWDPQRLCLGWPLRLDIAACLPVFGLS
jgi:hypothetical protein